MDISDDALSRLARRIDTQHFGPFVFQGGVDAVALALLLQRVDDAHRRFGESPLAHVVHAIAWYLHYVTQLMCIAPLAKRVRVQLDWRQGVVVLQGDDALG